MPMRSWAPALASCWAKSPNGRQEWLSVPRHLADAAAVTGFLWDAWVPEAVRHRVALDLDEPASARQLACLLAGLHDVGKITPAFAVQAPALVPAMEAEGLVVSPNVKGRSRLLPHALSGGLALREWLTERHWSPKSANALAVVIAGHHGRPPTTLSEGGPPELMGTGAWRDARNAAIGQVVTVVGAGPCLDAWARRPPGEAAQALLTAVVIVADWLASNVDLFPYVDAKPEAARTAWAWSQLGLPTPWRPAPPAIPASDAYWATRFALPPGANPRPVQRRACELLSTARDPRLLIVEAPMGEGKTEAALAAAEILAARSGAGGVMIALPTMATSDAMFRRVLQWLDRLPPPATGAAWSTYLAHGKSRLNDDFRLLPHDSMRAVGQDEGGTTIAHAWLAGRKKGVLSSFVVGTIDQVLVAALRTKHLALRHLALAGKVVILDEVHAADDYMQVFLDRALAWLGAYGVPVVLLSATLPRARRAALVDAYRSGRRPQERRRIESWRRGATPDPLAGHAPSGYPLLTLVDGDQVAHHPTSPSGRATEVTLCRIDDTAVARTLAGELRSTGTAAVICNTVGRAQQRASELRETFGNDVLLVHSRFLAADRQRLERRLRAALGPPEEAIRPVRLIVIGTQVLEQSLDIDVDLMVTDLAPVDLVLQRLGRLHRHDRPADSRPVGLQAPRCLVSGVRDWSAATPQAVPGSIRVYGEAALLRSGAVLKRHLDGQPIRLPDDIAPLVDDAYAAYDERAPDPRWPAELANAEHTAERKRQERQSRAERYRLRSPGSESQSLVGWLDNGTDEESAQGQAAVRDGVQGIEVLLLDERAGELRLPPWMELADRPLEETVDDELARAALGCAVRLPERCTETALNADLSAPQSWSSSGWLRDALVLRAHTEAGRLFAQLGRHWLTYDRQDGLIVTSGRTS